LAGLKLLKEIGRILLKLRGISRVKHATLYFLDFSDLVQKLIREVYHKKAKVFFEDTYLRKKKSILKGDLHGNSLTMRLSSISSSIRKPAPYFLTTKT
jgi:hypothetical protein